MAQKTMEEIFRSSPEFQAAVSPYLTQYVNFFFNVVSMGDTVLHPIALSSIPVELILIVARANNAGTVQVWGRDQIGANIGIQLAAGDVFTQAVDNSTWDMVEALCYVFEKKNNYPRKALDAGLWGVLASAATQVVDICLGFGPART